MPHSSLDGVAVYIFSLQGYLNSLRFQTSWPGYQGICFLECKALQAAKKQALTSPTDGRQEEA